MFKAAARDIVKDTMCFVWMYVLDVKAIEFLDFKKVLAQTSLVLNKWPRTKKVNVFVPITANSLAPGTDDDGHLCLVILIDSQVLGHHK